MVIWLGRIEMDGLTEREQLLSEIDHVIQLYQVFVVHSQKLYYKQDASVALEIGGKLHQLRQVCEKRADNGNP